MKTFFILRQSNWKDISKSLLMTAFLLWSYLLSAGPAHSEGTAALNGNGLGKAVIDFRTANPKLALVYLNLIGDTYRDQKLHEQAAHPEFVVIFGGQSVKLLAKDPQGYSPDELKTIDEAKAKISALADEGMEFDYCIYGGKLFGVSPAKVPGLNVVDNGWVSLVAYQTKGYAIVPAY